MTSLETAPHNLAHVLDVLPADDPVLTKVEPAKKKPSGGNGWNKRENLVAGGEARHWANQGGNVGVRLGLEVDGRILVVLDVEEDGTLPASVGELIEEHTLVVWTSPHGGRNRLMAVTPEAHALLDDVRTKINISDSPGHELELLTNGQALLPGSVVGHEHCSSSKPCRPSDGRDRYEHVSSNPEATTLNPDSAREMLDMLGLDPNRVSERPDRGDDWDGKLPKYDEKLADVGEAVLRSLQKESTPAFKMLSDWLRGGTRGYEELLKGEFGTDRSLQELMALTRLYEASRYEYGMEDEERALAVTRAKFEEYVRDNQFTDDGQRRKWLTAGESYREERLRRAAGGCDRGRFKRFLNQRPVDREWERWTGNYSDTTREIARFVPDLLTGGLAADPEDPDIDGLRKTGAILYGLDLDRDKLAELLNNPPTTVQDTTPNLGCVSPEDYPEQNEVVAACQKLDPSRDVATHEEVLRRLRRDGLVKQARVGRRYVVYPTRLSDPEEACEVRCNGEKREPKSSAAAGTDDVRLMADGGMPTNEQDDPKEETMSTTRRTTTPTEQSELTNSDFRELTDQVVVSRTNRGRVMHVPDEESDEVAPLCGTADRERGWVRKDTACYPPGHRGWCNRCAEKVRKKNTVKARASCTETPEWILTGEVSAGNALAVDW